MGQAWSVVVTREPEWDQYARTEAVAALAADRYRCKSCGVAGALVPVPAEDRDWTWGDGRVFRVAAYRCLACAAETTVSRDFTRRYEQDKPAGGVLFPTDGVRFQVSEIEQEVTHGGAS